MINQPRSQHSDSLIIVIPASVKTQAESIAKTAEPTLNGEVFTVALSPTGQTPATHYWCGWSVTPTQHGKLTAITKAGKAYIFDANQIKPEAVLSQLGLKRIETGEMLQS